MFVFSTRSFVIFDFKINIIFESLNYLPIRYTGIICVIGHSSKFSAPMISIARFKAAKIIKLQVNPDFFLKSFSANRPKISDFLSESAILSLE